MTGVIDVLDRQLAFRLLPDRHLERSYRLATVVLYSATEAQDAVHDPFMTAWRKYHMLRDPSRLAAWFDRIVVNTCRDRMRRNHRLRFEDISPAGRSVARRVVQALERPLGGQPG